MGSGSDKSSANMVAMQQRQAAEAREKETQRKARLTSGQQAIDYLFDGAPQGAQTLDLSGVANYTLPDSATPFFGGVGNTPLMTLDGGYFLDRTGDAGSGLGYGIYNSNKELVAQAATPGELAKQKIYFGGDASQRTGGFGDEFYNKFRQAQLDYYLPEVQRQFNNARFTQNASLARSGNLRSSQAGSNLADLVYQNDVNRAQLTAKADAATGDLRKQVAQNRQAAINQLYSTEDPTLAANTATGMVRNVQLTQPDLNPIGQLFSPIIAGIGSGMQSYGQGRAYASTSNPSSTTGGKSYTG